jgi:CHAT domain-containing protein
VRLPSHLTPMATATAMAPKHTRRIILLRLQQKQKELQRSAAHLLSELRRFDPEFSPEGVAPTLSFGQIHGLLPKDRPTAFVQLTVTHEETIALVTTCTEVFPIRLRALTDPRLWELAQEWDDQYYNPSFRGAKAALASACEGNKSETEGWALQQEAQRLMRRWLAEWHEALPGLLERVASQVVRPLLQALAAREMKLDRLVISPNHALHIFPLHACSLEAGGTRTFGDDFEVIYTPSLSVLGQCARRNREARGDRLIVGNPTGDLRFTEAEMAALRQHHPERVELWHRQATKQAFLAAAGSSWLLHYSGHTLFDPAEQLDAGLILAGAEGGMSGDLLSVREVFAGLNLRRNYLTILNGCESGMLRADMVDEYVSLPSGFLSAGAVCVIGTLWAVHDLSAALIMDRFHAEWQGGKSVAAALREATRWLRQDIRNGHHLMAIVIPEFLKHVEDPTLRHQCQESAQAFADKCPDSPPFASPVYWAPYTCNGLGY